jgi:hypothetical protein
MAPASGNDCDTGTYGVSHSSSRGHGEIPYISIFVTIPSK